MGIKSIGSVEQESESRKLIHNFEQEIIEKKINRKKFSKKLTRDFPEIQNSQINNIERCFDIFGKEDFSYSKVKEILEKNIAYDFNRLADRKIYKIAYSTKDSNFMDRSADERILIGIIKSNVDEQGYDYETRKSLVEFLDFKFILIGDMPFEIIHYINLMSGIYHLGLENGAPNCDWSEMLIQHQNNINDMINAYDQPTQNDDVMLGDSISNPHLLTDPYLLTTSAESFQLLSYYENNYNNVINITQQTPDECIESIKERLNDEDNVGKHLVIDLTGHGSKQIKGKKANEEYEKGDMEYGEIDRSREKFNEMFEIDDPRLIISIGSCNSAFKLDNTQDKCGLLYFDSGEQVSTTGSTKAFIRSNLDLNKDGRVSRIEKKVNELIIYNYSKTHLYRQKNNSTRIKIS